MKTYKDDGDNRKDHDCLSLLFGGNRLISVYTRLEHVGLLLFEI